MVAGRQEGKVVSRNVFRPWSFTAPAAWSWRPKSAPNPALQHRQACHRLRTDDIHSFLLMLEPPFPLGLPRSECPVHALR